MPQDVRVYLFSNGQRREEFAARIADEEKLSSRVRFMDFVPPWVVPDILRKSDLMLQLEHSFPVPAHSPIQPYEGVVSGTPLLLSGEVFKKVAPSFTYDAQQRFLTGNPGDIPALAEKLSHAITARKEMKENALYIREDFLSHYSSETALLRYEDIFTQAARRKYWFRRFF